MEIVKIPIADFLKYSLESAYEQGFSWIMCLLARDADAEETYQQVKRYWNSLNDVTGNTILFVFAGKQGEEKLPDSLLWHEAKDYRALTNPLIRFVNDNTPTVPRYIYPTFDYKTDEINELAVTHTSSITELKNFLGLSEKDIPSLVFIPTHKLACEKKVVVRLGKENLYRTVKGIIESLEEPLIKLKKTQDDYENSRRHLMEINKELEYLRRGRKTQKRFNEAKSYLDSLVKNTEDDSLKEWLQEAISKKSVNKWRRLDGQTLSYINRYVDLINQYPMLDDECDTIVSRIFKLEEEEAKVASVKNYTYEGLASMYDELTQIFKNIREEKNANMKADIPNLRRFKVAFSFPGEHRDKVEEIAEKLVEIFSKEQILYDRYHRAEFARPNLDTHLQKLYHDHSDLIVVFICADYQEKKWCGIEWRAIRDLLNQKVADDRIMFVKCGQGAVDGVFGTIDGYIDTNEVSTDDIVSDIVIRHKSLA